MPLASAASSVRHDRPRVAANAKPTFRTAVLTSLRGRSRLQACSIPNDEDHPMSTDNTIRARLAFMRLDDAKRATLRELKPIIGKVLPGVLDEFYATSPNMPRSRGCFTTRRSSATPRRCSASTGT
jgi:hypothetical protein